MILPLLLAAAAPAATSFAQLDGHWRPIWGLCDGAALLTIGRPDKGEATIAWYDRRTLRSLGTARYALGRADPGAGNVYRALRRDGRDAGNIRTINPGMMDPAPRVPALSSITLRDARAECRLLPGTVLIAVTPKRSVTVTREGGGLVYRAFDPGAARPTLQLRGQPDRDGALFAQGVYSYRITADPVGGGGAVLVQRSGEAIGRERFLAYSVATPAPFR